MKYKSIKTIILPLVLTITFLFSACIFESKVISDGNNLDGKLVDNVPGALADDSDETTEMNDNVTQSLEAMNDAQDGSEIENRPLDIMRGGKNIMMLPIPVTAGATRPGTTATLTAVASIKLSESKKSIKVGDKTQINATVQPSNASDKTVRWTTSNPDIAFVEGNGEVIALKKGKSTITCIANGGNNVMASCEVTVKSGAVVSYLYDDRGFFYVEDDPWQRNFGFNRLYDFGAAYAVMYYNTVRVKFNYNGLDWMVQMWKGQYGYAFIGSEIGVYTKPQSRTLEHYDCASDANSLKMEMSIYRNGKRLFARDYATYWWITGFVPGTIMDSNGTFGDRSGLIMTARITLKDADMTNAFVTALEGCGFKNEGYEGVLTPDRFAVTENDVCFCWRYLAQAPVMIAFDPANGTPVISSKMECGATLNPPEISREGYTLAGWSPDIPSIVPVENNTYTAKWEINSYTISFDANGGTGSISTVTQEYNTSLTLPGSGFELEGYTFAGWNTTPDAAEPLDVYSIPSRNETLYAVYKINEVPTTQEPPTEPGTDGY